MNMKEFNLSDKIRTDRAYNEVDIKEFIRLLKEAFSLKQCSQCGKIIKDRIILCCSCGEFCSKSCLDKYHKRRIIMAKKVTLGSRKGVRKPTRVRFVNRYGELVSFKGTKNVTVPKKVTFYANKPRRRK